MGLRCKRCGSMMIAASAKSGKFHYYACQTYIKKGRQYCSQKFVPAKKIEPFIVQTIKERILTRDNIYKLLLMLDDELKKLDAEYKTKLELLAEVIEDKIARRKKLYEGIETAMVSLPDVAPRLKELNQEIADLEQQKAKIIETHQNGEGLKIAEDKIKPYIDDLQEMLMEGSIAERRGFIRSFIKTISVDYPQLKFEYSLPLLPQTKDRTSSEVLSAEQYGVANGDRTRNL